MLAIDPEAFEELVDQALDQIPEDLFALADNVIVVIEADAPPDDPDLLGLYDGVPLTERGSTYGVEGTLPDVISIFRNPILAICDTHEDVVREVRITVLHEVAHHFGIDDERLHELGYA